MKRQPHEFIKSYIHRLSTAVYHGWPNPHLNGDQRTTKKIEFFVRGLSPPGLKQKAHQFLIDNPPATWQQLKDPIATKDLIFAISSEFIGMASSSIDNKLEIEGIKDQLKELTGLMKNHSINAAYNPHEHRNKQNKPMFCNWCCMSGHTIRHCFNYNDQQEQNYHSLQLRENSNRSYHNYSKSRLRVDSNFNDINPQQEFRHLSNLNESSEMSDRSNSKKPFNENNDYHLSYQIHNFSDDDIPGDYTNNECELVTLF